MVHLLEPAVLLGIHRCLNGTNLAATRVRTLEREVEVGRGDESALQATNKRTRPAAHESTLHSLGLCQQELAPLRCSSGPYHSRQDTGHNHTHSITAKLEPSEGAAGCFISSVLSKYSTTCLDGLGFLISSPSHLFGANPDS